MLSGKIAVVTGGTREAGRGIALQLGEAGATVYVTGRSSRQNQQTGRPETIEETAEMVTARGGVGISVQVDHSQPDTGRSNCPPFLIPTSNTRKHPNMWDGPWSP